jgi:uncharacterized protein YciI
MRFRVTPLLSLLTLFAGSTAARAVAAQDSAPRSYQMKTYYLVFLRKGSPREATPSTPETDPLSLHRVKVGRLEAAGTVRIAGRVEQDSDSDSDMREILVMDAPSLQAAKRLLDDDPAVRAGALRAECYQWYAASGLRVEGPGEEAYYFVVLRSGPRSGAGDSTTRARMFDAHMANIRRLAATGAMVVAGPIDNGEGRRGIFILHAGSLSEAQQLVASDPGVQAGEFRPEYYRWLVPSNLKTDANR